LKTRSDDQDEEAINKRHDIYYDIENGTLAAVNYFKELSTKRGGKPKIVELDGRPGVKEVTAELLSKL
nr:adenylate kinase [Desulfobacterales bacterium]